MYNIIHIAYVCLNLFRTKALVLELLAAICLVKGGHEIILSAFNNFKEVCQEKKRFQTLMDYFINYEVFHIEFMVCSVNILSNKMCLQHINNTYLYIIKCIGCLHAIYKHYCTFG